MICGKNMIVFGVSNPDSNRIRKELNCKPVYNKTFLRTKIRSCSNETTDFHILKILQAGSNCIPIFLKFKLANKTLANSDVYKLSQQKLLAAEIEEKKRVIKEHKNLFMNYLSR